MPYLVALCRRPIIIWWALFVPLKGHSRPASNWPLHTLAGHVWPRSSLTLDAQVVGSHCTLFRHAGGCRLTNLLDTPITHGCGLPLASTASKAQMPTTSCNQELHELQLSRSGAAFGQWCGGNILCCQPQTFWRLSPKYKERNRTEKLIQFYLMTKQQSINK